MNRSERGQFRKRAAAHVMRGYAWDLKPHKVERIIGLLKPFQVTPTGRSLFEECSVASAKKIARAALKDLNASGQCKVDGSRKDATVTFSATPKWLVGHEKAMPELEGLAVAAMQLLPFYLIGRDSMASEVYKHVFKGSCQFSTCGVC